MPESVRARIIKDDATVISPATEDTLAEISAKITGCDTSGLATSDNQTNGNQVVKGANTPGTIANPADVIHVFALLGGYTGSNWVTNTAIRANADSIGVNSYANMMQAFMWMFNGTSFDRIRGDITNGLDVDVTRQATYFGKGITYVQVSQGSAGTTQLIAASAPNKHKVVGCFLALDAAGTLLFTDGTISSGAVPLAANTPLVLPTQILPFWETGAINRAISITTASGKAFGTVAILTEP